MDYFKNLAELISAFAALLTVGLAFIELMSRSKAKRAEEAISIYADYLHVQQELEYAVHGAQNLSFQWSHMSRQDILAYAYTHKVSPKLMQLVHSMEQHSICHLDYRKKDAKETSEKVLDLSGKISNLLQLVNTFYQLIIQDENITAEIVLAHQKRISNAHQQLNTQLSETETFFKSNLKQMKSRSNVYLIFLLVSLAVFLLILQLIR